MSRKYTSKNPLLIKWALRYLLRQTKYIKKKTHRRWAKEDLRAIAYYFGLYWYWNEIKNSETEND